MAYLVKLLILGTLKRNVIKLEFYLPDLLRNHRISAAYFLRAAALYVNRCQLPDRFPPA